MVTRRGIELTLQTIVVLIILLILLVSVLLYFREGFSGFASSVGGIFRQANESASVLDARVIDWFER